MPSPDLRRLSQFAAAMDAPSLAVAAERLHVSQQALSASIRQLEKELGTALFTRSGRRLAPTAAARTLYDGAGPLLSGAEQLVRSTRDAGTGRVPPFVVGRSPAITPAEAYSLIEPLVGSEEAPSITVREVFPSEVAGDLRTGTVDLVLRRGAGTPADLAVATAAFHPLRVAMHRDHPLAAAAGRRELHLPDLAASPIAVWAPPHHSFYTDFLVAQCRLAGFEPDLRVNPVQGTAPASAALVIPEACVFVTDLPGDQFGGRVRVRDLADAPRVPVQALWLPHTHSPAREALLAAWADAADPGGPLSAYGRGRTDSAR